MKFLIIFFLSLLSIKSVCQRNDSIYSKLTHHAIALKTGIIYQKGTYLEVGFIRQKYMQDISHHVGDYYGNHGPSFSTEVRLNFNDFIIAPRIGYEYYLMFFGFKGSLATYTDFKTTSTKFLPEIGITLLGFAFLSVGYNIPLYNRDFVNNNRFRFAFVINFPIKFVTYSQLRKRRTK